MSRVESNLGRRLGREASGDFDWFVTVNGKTYDAVGPVPDVHFNIGQFSASVTDHLNTPGLNVVVVDMRGLSPLHIAEVENFLSTLTPAQLGRLIIRR